MDKERQKVINFEAELEKEEKILEGIRDGLKGNPIRDIGDINESSQLWCYR